MYLHFNCAIIFFVLLSYNGLFVDSVPEAVLDGRIEQYRQLAAEYMSQLKKGEMLDVAHAILKASGENAKVNQILSELKTQLRPEVMEIQTHFMAEHALIKAEEHIKTLKGDEEKRAKKLLAELKADFLNRHFQ
ncbi:hypothetical protein DdX_22494 [Ditylenchus destructor]|uniref:Uncharacterized protein n=1 Tax=Ditylenchus destructor TaxID=166010 RepID=A0AAD4MDK2_9BILA|nr:hypothetical protein DdX_22494 [Ditylenchus destructor]